VFVSGAVKFGDPLYLEECEILLKNLSECQVPFQCAHGRPSLVPIVDLQHVHTEEDQVRPLYLKKGVHIFRCCACLSMQDLNPWSV
jgi:hypothetical protein